MAEASFDSHLMDGWDAINQRIDRNHRMLGDLSDFFKKLAKIEYEFGKSLHALLNKEGSKVVEAEHVTGTVLKSFTVMHEQLELVSVHHGEFSTSLANQVSGAIDAYVKEVAKDKAKLAHEQARIKKEFQKQKDTLRKAKDAYDGAGRKVASAMQSLDKARQDPGSKQSDIAKLEGKVSHAEEKQSKLEQEYRQALTFMNQQQVTYYTQTMPGLLKRYEEFDQARTTKVKEFMGLFASAFLFKPPTYQTAVEEIFRTSEAISAQGDATSFAKAAYTGVAVPDDIPFEEMNPSDAARGGAAAAAGGVTSLSAPSAPYAAPTSPSSLSSSTTSSAAVASKGAPPAVPSSKGKPPAVPKSSGRGAPPIPHKRTDPPKVYGLTAADEHLSTGEKRLKLNAQRKECSDAIAHAQKARKGLEALIGFYKDDNEAARRAAEELQDSQAKLSQLESALKKIEQDIMDLPVGATRPSSATTMLSAGPPPPLPSKAGKNTGGGNDAVATEAPAPASVEDVAAAAQDDAEEYPTILETKAAYAYEAANDGELSLAEGEAVAVKAKDDSGWWYAEVRGVLGYVPASYLDCEQ